MFLSGLWVCEGTWSSELCVCSEVSGTRLDGSRRVFTAWFLPSREQAHSSAGVNMFSSLENNTMIYVPVLIASPNPGVCHRCFFNQNLPSPTIYLHDFRLLLSADKNTTIIWASGPSYHRFSIRDLTEKMSVNMGRFLQVYSDNNLLNWRTLQSAPNISAFKQFIWFSFTSFC